MQETKNIMLHWKTEYYKGSFSYIGGGMLRNSLLTEIKASESEVILSSKLASWQKVCCLDFINCTY